MDIELTSTAEFRERYQELLRREWTQSAFETAVQLVRDQLSTAGLVLKMEGEDDEREEDPRLYPIPPGASDFLQEHLESLNYTLRLQHEATKAHRQQTRAEKRLKSRCLLTALLLSFPAWPAFGVTAPADFRVQVRGDARLFDDSRSILYLLTIHDLLPRIEEKEWHDLRILLLQALYIHATIAWGHNPAHQSYLLAEFYDFVGDQEKASEALFAAFRSTGPSDHDYMTTAFAYWSYQIDRCAIEQAVDFALKVYRTSLPQWLPKAEDMLRESFRRLYGRH